MAYLTDTEGEELTILNLDNNKTWEVYVSPDSEGEGYKGISIALSIPEYLTDGENEYSSLGLLTANLEQVFDEYLDEVDMADNGESLAIFINMMEKYKAKAEAKKIELDSKYDRK
jgi:hypothetical protein